MFLCLLTFQPSSLFKPLLNRDQKILNGRWCKWLETPDIQNAPFGPTKTHTFSCSNVTQNLKTYTSSAQRNHKTGPHVIPIQPSRQRETRQLSQPNTYAHVAQKQPRHSLPQIWLTFYFITIFPLIAVFKSINFFSKRLVKFDSLAKSCHVFSTTIKSLNF